MIAPLTSHDARDVPALLLTPRDAAKALAVCEKTVWAMAKRGDIRPVRIGRAVRYCAADLQDFIESAMVNNGAKPK